MSVITQMLQRITTTAQTAMAVVDNNRDVARTRFFTAPQRGICSEFSPQSRPARSRSEPVTAMVIPSWPMSEESRSGSQFLEPAKDHGQRDARC
jgi:hypothetical protein